MFLYVSAEAVTCYGNDVDLMWCDLMKISCLSNCIIWSDNFAKKKYFMFILIKSAIIYIPSYSDHFSGSLF